MTLSIKACKMINDGIKDEEDAINFYNKMLLMGNPGLVDLSIANIRQDERKHKNTLETLREMCD